jgi:DNA-nicking Smr family endonuclease
MVRRLTAHERALWSRVAASVRPMAGKDVGEAPPPQTAPKPPPIALQRPAPTPATIPPRPLQKPKNAPVAVAAATLDGGWDRRLRQGDISPDRVIDLHGHTLETAHLVLSDALESADFHGQRIILIVTGKGRSDRPGRIKAELSHWLDNGNYRSRIAALRPAHPRHGGTGAFYLILRRRP